VTTTESAAPLTAPPRDEFWRRALLPIGVVPLAFLIAIVFLGLLELTPMGDRARGVIASFVASLAILLLALALRARLPAHLARASTALKHSAGGALGLGLTVGAGLLVATASVFAFAVWVDPTVRGNLDSLRDDVGLTAWQKALTIAALVALAPLGEELLFRGLLLRALVRRMEFWPAALISGVIFGIAHVDQYVPYPIWPRTLTLAGTGVVLAWLYRWRGYWGSVAAHASVNLGAAIALLAS
jgi:membrane protease YdiL (CAAX protease family)